jgi:hypothetical protein
MDQHFTMKRPVALRVRESIDKYVPIIESWEPEFQEFSDVIDLVKIVVFGLARYHWWFTSHEHRKLINTMRLEDDYSRNVTLIGRQLRIYASSPGLILRQKKFLDRLDYILGRCLQEALELFEESEKALVRMGSKIYMSASDGYGEHERKEAALWGFQKEFHKRQLDYSRGPDKAIIYPPAGFDNYGLSNPGGRGPNNGNTILTAEELLGLKQFLNSLSKPDILRNLLNVNTNNPTNNPPDNPPDNGQLPVTGDNTSGANITQPVIPGPQIPTKPPPGILKGKGSGTIGFGAPGGKGGKNVHFVDSNKLPLPSSGASGGSPAASTVGKEKGNEPPNLPDIFSTASNGPGPDDGNNLPPPTPTFGPPSSPISLSSSDDNTPPPDPTAPGTAGTETPSDQDSPTSPSSSSSSSLPSVRPLSPTESSSGTEDTVENTTSPNPSENDIEVAIGAFLVFMVAQSSTEDGDEISISPTLSEDEIEDRIREFMKTLETIPSTGNTDLSMDDIEVRIREVLKYLGVIPSTNAALPKDEVEVRRELALSIRAYLGRRHDEYSTALSALSTRKDAEREDESEKPLYLAHPSLVPTVRKRNSSAARDVKKTALLHWAGVTSAKRQERINGYTRLRAVMKWAEKKGKVPLSPSSIRASTGLRRGLFEPLGAPDLSLVGKHERKDRGPGPYREATLANLAVMQPWLGLNLRAFLFNQDMLRLFGGLVGEQPQPRDLARMDRLLRELVSGIW